MKYWTIAFPGEFGQHVVETWSEDQIIKSYYKYWFGKMVECGKTDMATRERCIEDWTVVHWAYETDQFGRELENELKLKYNDRWDAYYDAETYEWIDSKCSDPTCEYCTKRPEKAPREKFLDIGANDEIGD